MELILIFVAAFLLLFTPLLLKVGSTLYRRIRGTRMSMRGATASEAEAHDSDRRGADRGTYVAFIPIEQRAEARPGSLAEGMPAMTVRIVPRASKTPLGESIRRIESLPPLKRAIVWSEILGPPVSEREPR